MIATLFRTVLRKLRFVHFRGIFVGSKVIFINNKIMRVEIFEEPDRLLFYVDLCTTLDFQGYFIYRNSPTSISPFFRIRNSIDTINKPFSVNPAISPSPFSIVNGRITQTNGRLFSFLTRNYTII